VREGVERRLVGPVAVLDHAHGRGAARELLAQRTADVPRLAGLERPGEHPAELPRKVAYRGQRLGHREVVAAAPQHAQLWIRLLRHAANQRRLADSGLPCHDHDPARPRRRVRDGRRESIEGGAALEQPTATPHVPTITGFGPPARGASCGRAERRRG
jgi:hypothetical protein